MLPHNQTENPIHDLLGNRWSPRSFAPDREIDSATLASLFEAARWSASSSNGQPWSFIVATRSDAEEFEKLLACLVPANQVWAKNASALVLSVADKTFSHNGKPNAHAFYDTGAAAAYLTVEATARGLYVHQMAGFDPAKARQTYSIPDSADPAAAMAIGYLGDPQSLPEPLREREQAKSVRKPLADFVFHGKWGQTAKIVKK